MVVTWDKLAAAPIEETIAWAETQPWCDAMRRCAQDAQWHAEGDVWTHTKMVCTELLALDEWPAISARERTILIFTALFHDAAKPLTTRVDSVTGRTTSPKHAVRGEQLARNILRELGCDLTLREEIARMVRYHGRPAFLLEREHPAHEVVKLSVLTSNRLLYLFALADSRGRTTAEMTRPEENLQLWRMVAEENECFTTPYRFANDHARFLFFRQEQPNLYYTPHEEFTCTVTMTSGLPGSGKDYWIGANQGMQPVVSLDALRAELGVDATDDQGRVIQAGRERCRDLLRSKTSFSFNATNIMRQTRSRWIELFADYGARVELVYLEPPLGRLLEQNSQRKSAVPQEVMLRLTAKVEPPTLAECHRLHYGE